MSKPEGQLSKWRDDLLLALSPNGSLLIDLVPELKLIIGEQSPVAATASRRENSLLSCISAVYQRFRAP